MKKRKRKTHLSSDVGAPRARVGSDEGNSSGSRRPHCSRFLDEVLVRAGQARQVVQDLREMRTRDVRYSVKEPTAKGVREMRMQDIR